MADGVHSDRLDRFSKVFPYFLREKRVVQFEGQDFSLHFDSLK